MPVRKLQEKSKATNLNAKGATAGVGVEEAQTQDGGVKHPLQEEFA